MFQIGMTEIIIIVIALAIFFTGGNKITEWARNLGRFIGEFKKAKKEAEEELKKVEKEIKKDEGGEQK
jgi:sec-independent protein translocase protein TatA